MRATMTRTWSVSDVGAEEVNRTVSRMRRVDARRSHGVAAEPEVPNADQAMASDAPMAEIERGRAGQAPRLRKGPVGDALEEHRGTPAPRTPWPRAA